MESDRLHRRVNSRSKSDGRVVSSISFWGGSGGVLLVRASSGAGLTRFISLGEGGTLRVEEGQKLLT